MPMNIGGYGNKEPNKLKKAAAKNIDEQVKKTETSETAKLTKDVKTTTKNTVTYEPMSRGAETNSTTGGARIAAASGGRGGVNMGYLSVFMTNTDPIQYHITLGNNDSAFADMDVNFYIDNGASGASGASGTSNWMNFTTWVQGNLGFYAQQMDLLQQEINDCHHEFDDLENQEKNGTITHEQYETMHEQVFSRFDNLVGQMINQYKAIQRLITEAFPNAEIEGSLHDDLWSDYTGANNVDNFWENPNPRTWH